ncbi:hypothetical protein HKBW3C_02415 [Candidatus Hakubella thermalkaliphila]|nr:hypothetical protein HKBW3C_02415 [Candidatus Hakubella thermalkaliphila]
MELKAIYIKCGDSQVSLEQHRCQLNLTPEAGAITATTGISP